MTKCIRSRKNYVKIPTHPPIFCNKEDFEGFRLWKEKVQALQFFLKNQLYMDYPLVVWNPLPNPSYSSKIIVQNMWLINIAEQ